MSEETINHIQSYNDYEYIVLKIFRGLENRINEELEELYSSSIYRNADPYDRGSIFADWYNDQFIDKWDEVADTVVEQEDAPVQCTVEDIELIEEARDTFFTWRESPREGKEELKRIYEEYLESKNV